ncbi:prolyl oligopeptidase family serine peptidase [Prevotella copri]|jgi:dipeptidyl aminopeptidase/acylaminoacyl peptidase|uniref:Prolyl oligopeptidase family serine peptidase n=1 Tax=Segatella copri TaxID=165179 RepID=A0AAW5IPB6_9BACT|nr:prolyl oligopeptidase family serine peptidase [Segatella copri]MCP9551899.1 prolyl oligopeptidase family serine peptidase [Segatella copri]MCP9572613.1 prolyl oligopeptidase family serine peptidase [Segatella copri]MCP9575766.1 prolyl oligopeptidase family serine peptidase [Segatella copri]MCP9578711.1 prolyl oligopeptidase family serine peptidase [Segatella copri]MCP9581659.1 prolyl oligopeptidase family serine peptidase [Segatella copri]
MNKLILKTTKSRLVAAALMASISASAETIEVKTLKYAGPYAVAQPWMADSVNIKGEAFDLKQLLDSPLSFTLLNKGKEVTAAQLLADKQDALHLASFCVSNTQRTKATIAVEGLEQYRLFVDGEQVAVNGDKAETILTPSQHTVVIKYLTRKNASSDKKSIKLTVTAADGAPLSVGDATAKRAYNIYDVICAPNYPSVSISPNGKFIVVRKTWVDRKGNNHSISELRNSQTNRVMATFEESVKWMPSSNKLYFTQKASDSSIAGEEKQDGTLQLITINPLTMEREVLAANIPDGWFQFTPDEKTLIYTLYTEGRKKDAQVYDVKEPDDRQPGWRSRSYLAKFDLASGVLQPLTFGYHNVYFNDISADSRYLLIGKSEERLTKRPTTLNSYYRLNLNDMSVETLIEKGEFLNSAQFSPDGKSILVSASPEAFNGIGKNVEEGQTPSMIDTQLYLMTLSDKKVRPLTKDFNPNVQSTEWSKVDGNIYFTAEDKDCVHLFQLNPKSGKFTLLKTPEEYIKSFSLASSAAEMAFSGQSASNADRLYKMNTKALKSQLVDDLSARELKDVELGECKAWNFVNSRGDTLCCRYYLPPHFDAAKKYPMIVNYYGGCSPTSRMFQSRYPHHVYAAMGYVVLVVNPSGATGFGQKFSARHVDTAGEGVAEDIISSTQAFCDEHAFVNRKKIGCIGASYGGFMTQYLQTKTDLFAAAISHAGISDHTSYWGEGYWGYSYSEVSMANEYPWTNKHLFVDQSPLYNADKIHTPLLFVHGTADNNVPVGESIQLYTALKLLGRPTAMVLVDGQDHHIIDYEKRLKWQNTIFAWFAKWLQDDASWWTEMYGDEKM